jgi:uncharacterized protein (DUF433 family)
MVLKTIIKDYIVFKDNEARIVGKEHLKAELVARMHVNGERDIEYVMEHYGLTRAEVHAALTYYYENQQALDEAYEKSWAESKAVKSSDLRARIEARMSKDK